MSEIGKGVPSYRFGTVTGTVCWFRSPADVIAAIDSDLESTIAVVESGGTTFLSPILGRLGGIVSRDGTLRSHLAIVSREFEVPCLVGTQLVELPEDGAVLTLEAVDSSSGVVRSDGAAPVPTEVPDVSAGWWDYVRRPGDEIGVKDFDVAVTPQALDALIAEELTDERLDELVQHMGRAFKPEMTRRSSFTSELFPMLPYMSMSVIDDFHTYAGRVATIEAAMPAEEIGRRLRTEAGLVSPLWIWMAGYHYLCGRECLIKMGELARDERTDEIRTVVDFWRRLTLAHRGDGTLDNKDAGFTNRYLPAAVVDELSAGADELGPDEARALKRLNATVAGYSFLYFTDSRVGIYDSGPYERPDGRLTLVRDYLSLGPSAFAYPWAEQLQPPFDGLTLTLTYDPKAFESFEINDWGTTFTEPDQLLAAVTEATVHGSTVDGRRRLAPDEWADVTSELSKSHLAIYQTFADMDRTQRILSATTMYTAGLRPFAEVAGVVDSIDWSISPDTMALYPDPLGDDEKAAVIFGTALVANDLPGAFSPTR